MPQDAEDYVHRIGRTARAGASGKAITLACETYVMALEAIEGLIGFRLPVVHVEDDMLVKPVPPSHRHRAAAAARPGGRRARRRRRVGRPATVAAGGAPRRRGGAGARATEERCSERSSAS